MDATQITRLGRYRPLYVDDQSHLWASRGNTLYCSDDDAVSFAKIATYRAGALQGVAVLTKLGTRLSRGGFHSLRVLPTGTVIAIVRGGILRLTKGQQVVNLVHNFRHGSRPLSLCTTPSGGIFYGEYWGNPDRQDVRIYGSFDDGRSWHVVHTFPKNTIRHIHGIYYDKHRDGCWILTGDTDDESRILFSDTAFSNLDIVAKGSQRCRAVAIVPLSSGLVVPTDTEHEQNYIQWLDPASGRLDRIVAIPGTVFYCSRTRDKILLSTVVEPSTVNLSRQATIWSSSNGEEWAQIYAKPKDHWSPVYFQYGTFVLPPNDGDTKHAYAGGQAVVDDDQRLLKISFVGP